MDRHSESLLQMTNDRCQIPDFKFQISDFKFESLLLRGLVAPRQFLLTQRCRTNQPTHPH